MFMVYVFYAGVAQRLVPHCGSRDSPDKSGCVGGSQ
jgi:hypothetical protein